MAITDFFSGVAAADYEVLREWYERFFGRPPDFFPREDEAVWRVADSSWLYVVADPLRAGSGLVTILVDDVEAHVAELAGRGLETDGIEQIPGARRAVLVDPEGNRVTVGEPIEPDQG